jgi:hypothetical protein
MSIERKRLLEVLGLDDTTEDSVVVKAVCKSLQERVTINGAEPPKYRETGSIAPWNLKAMTTFFEGEDVIVESTLVLKDGHTSKVLQREYGESIFAAAQALRELPAKIREHEIAQAKNNATYNTAMDLWKSRGHGQEPPEERKVLWENIIKEVGG